MPSPNDRGRTTNAAGVPAAAWSNPRPSTRNPAGCLAPGTTCTGTTSDDGSPPGRVPSILAPLPALRAAAQARSRARPLSVCATHAVRGESEHASPPILEEFVPSTPHARWVDARASPPQEIDFVYARSWYRDVHNWPEESLFAAPTLREVADVWENTEVW